MDYIKLMALKIDDFCSSIYFEDNYANSDLEVVKKDIKHLEEQGCICFLLNVKSNIETNTYDN